MNGVFFITKMFTLNKDSTAMKSFTFIFIVLSQLFLVQLQAAKEINIFSQTDRLSGYKQISDSTFFIFDENVYHVQPHKVMLEGEMRGWDHNMQDSNWQLKKSLQKGLWILKVHNPAMQKVPPGSAFKFRINDGQWLEPPISAVNISSGNLIFAYNQQKLPVKAEIVSPRNIRLLFPSKKAQYIYSPDQYTLSTYGGKNIPIKRVFYSAPGELQIVPTGGIDIRRLHYLEIKYLQKKVTLSYDGWFRSLYSDKELGANYLRASDQTVIRLFVPRADSVFVFLYKKPKGRALKRIPLCVASDGIWEIYVPGNFEGWYYDFTAFGPDEPGNYFSNNKHIIHFSDPWGRVSVDSFGPCRIWPKMQPATALKNGIPKMEDLIAYEVHVQDFTRHLPLADSLKGTFKAFVRSGLKNAQGEKIGFDHLLELGINAVHLMPVQEFLHYPDADWQKAFLNDPYMIEQGINKENYQWGYRTTHAFALESRYRVKDSQRGSQNKDFRDLVQAFHNRDIAVIVDLVFNHTAERMDGRQFHFNFLAMDAPYFYRMDENFNFYGAYGTETKSEERPMMQRWIIEQCTNLINQYGVDGFRIDLAGLTDEQTLKALREAVGPDIIIYGEPWIGSSDPDYEKNPDWDWYKKDAPITFFQDETRNAFKGPPSNPKNKLTDRGYAGGNGERESVKKALAAAFPEDKTPLSGINYLDIHDNWALADRFAKTNWDGRFGVDEAAYKIAATLLFTSPGPIVLHGGSELMRSKGVASLKEVVKYLNGKALYFHGKKDTYNLAKANAFVWDNKGLNIGDKSSVYCNYENMFDFWKGLIALRKSMYGKVFRIAEKPPTGYYRWFEPENSKLLGYVVNNTVFVLINTDESADVFKDIILPDGKWRQIADINTIDLANGLASGKYKVLTGQKEFSFEIPPNSLFIWIRK